jgi:hypothetical protein
MEGVLIFSIDYRVPLATDLKSNDTSENEYKTFISFEI